MTTIRLRYDGPFDSVDTADGQTVERGKVAEFSDVLGAAYREQDVWTEVDADGNEVPQPEPADDETPDTDNTPED